MHKIYASGLQCVIRELKGFSRRKSTWMRAYGASWHDEAFVQQAAAQDQVAHFCHQSWQFLRTAEAGGALVGYALGQLGLWRIVATTDHDNLASQGMMHKLGMALHRNTVGEPPYLQVVVVLQA